MANPPGKCIFCEGPHLSKEHVFGEWLKELFPRDEKSTHTYGVFQWAKGVIAREPKTAEHKRAGHAGTRKVRVVCRACNSEWLGALEEHTKPILTPLIIGDRSNLSPAMQAILASWAAKTAMTAEWITPRERGISQEERTWLRRHHLPPDNWHVWIAGYNGTLWRELGLYQHRGTLVESSVSGPSQNTFDCHATTFGIGHILFLVVGTTWGGAPLVFGNVERATSLLQIWPAISRTILWPPARILGDPQANAVANILTRSGAFDQALNPGADWTFTM